MQVTLLKYPSPRYEYSGLTRAELDRALEVVDAIPLTHETSDDDTLKITIVQVTEEERQQFEREVFG
jgi:hypothetical protein